MSMRRMEKGDEFVCDLSLNGVSPQKAIRRLTDIINRTKQDKKRRLVIEEYDEDFGNPFEQNPTRCLRIVIKKEIVNE